MHNATQRIVAPYGKLGVELAADFPVSIDNTALLTVRWKKASRLRGFGQQTPQLMEVERFRQILIEPRA